MARLIAAHLTRPPPRPSTTQPNVPAQVDEVIATGMAKDPDHRYATTVELADAARDAVHRPHFQDRHRIHPRLTRRRPATCSARLRPTAIAIRHPAPSGPSILQRPPGTPAAPLRAGRGQPPTRSRISRHAPLAAGPAAPITWARVEPAQQALR